ncbi:hypothetical protein M406DRAFT_59874 [Cryphonectria parasitica EP155]|uniref:FAD-binding domain-containing protein n=1 Tax=Cryphonectria parasitica (strain ATCC 38755 / EP155) TaxID=660469 RepID=A0A9P4YDM7_CRYP1|nr:uncharacterized protein M406DRAFT_59874 [Cryphonectria parasitica EP155]KAF3771113.1 hypothetical protein M406DRAFT_59874 [Cryphonectria parasitica EP155]
MVTWTWIQTIPPPTVPAQTTRLHPVQSLSTRMSPSGSFPCLAERHDVCIVGAGPAGLMLGLTLARLGITPLILDERAEQTPAGRADGMQPKTIETLRMLGLADELLQQGVRVYDLCLWHAAADDDCPVRVARETHYPAFIVDLVDPFMLVGHQGMVERAFEADLAKRGVSVRRCHRFEGLRLIPNSSSSSSSGGGGGRMKTTMEVQSHFNVTREPRAFEATYLVGCDGAHSRVRKMINPHPAARDDQVDEMSVWGVLDGEVDTDFPDVWTKAVISSERFGSILIMPRERDMTRLYIEMRPDADPAAAGTDPRLVQAAVMRRAAQILLPYRIRWRTVEWFGQYRVSQRASDDDNPPRVFIAGDAAHTHSPKAAQGMNTALHDSWNLAWKLNLAVRGLCRASVLLGSYEAERRKIARDLVTFDYEHAAEMSRGDPAALAENFRKNVRFISGVGVEYGENKLNQMEREAEEKREEEEEEEIKDENDDDDDDDDDSSSGSGCTLPPGKVSRYIDANPIDVQLDIPVLGQFKVYIFVPDVVEARQGAFLTALCGAIAEQDSLLSRLSAAASQSYLERPRVPSSDDLFKRPERYTAVSQLFVFALITSTEKSNFEIAHLPQILSRSPWTIYLDDVPDLDTQGTTCTEKYLGARAVSRGEVAVLNVRPDGYVGSLKTWDLTGLRGGAAEAAADVGREAAGWLERYYDGFLVVPG